MRELAMNNEGLGAGSDEAVGEGGAIYLALHFVWRRVSIAGEWVIKKYRRF